MRLLLGIFVGWLLVAGANAQGYSYANVTVVYPPPQPAPDVVIIRTHRVPQPVGLREEPLSQVTYFIAFRNSEVRLANQYWVNGKTLYFVTLDHERMTAPLNSIDRGLSQQLNSEQNLAFSLPSEQGKTIAHARIVHNNGISTRRQCCCTSGSPAGGRASRSSSATR
jgi:hypothetical protein